MVIGPFTPPIPQGATRRFRDLVLMGIDDDLVLCIACDSSGGFGSKPSDVRQADGFEVGYSVAKVPLMETLAAGARPTVLIDNLCVEMHPSGLPILSGIRAACAESGYDIEISGSDETNFPTVQTGVGTTVISLLRRAESRLGSSRDGDCLVVVGRPLGGQSDTDYYEEGSELVAGIGSILSLLALPGVHEILPVGSRGIAFEAAELAASSGLLPMLRGDTGVDLTRSAGASTAVVCSCAPDAVDGILSQISGSTLIGRLSGADR